MQLDSLEGRVRQRLLAGDSIAAPAGDSLYRLVKGYRRVKIFRNDFQAVCDSLVAVSTDSMILLYIDPVLWNQDNQITSDVMKIYTEKLQTPESGIRRPSGHVERDRHYDLQPGDGQADYCLFPR